MNNTGNAGPENPTPTKTQFNQRFKRSREPEMMITILMMLKCRSCRLDVRLLDQERLAFGHLSIARTKMIIDIDERDLSEL